SRRPSSPRWWSSSTAARPPVAMPTSTPHSPLPSTASSPPTKPLWRQRPERLSAEPRSAAPGEAGEPGTEAALQAVFAALPDFPRFRLGRTFDTWVHELARTEDVADLATVLGSISTRTFSRIIIAVTLVHGLPQFFARCEAQEFTIEHVHAAARVAKDLPFEELPELDKYLGRR